MSRPLAVIRPEPGWSATASAARALRLEILGQPLFECEPLAWTLPPTPSDALLIGSAAAFRHGGPQLASLRALPVHAVGVATARAAAAAGFAVARVGEGDLQALLDTAPLQPMRYLRLSGEERVALVGRPNQPITERIVYRMVPRPIGPQLAAALSEQKPITALHSAAAARHFAAEIDRLGIARGKLFLLVLSARVAKAAGAGWAAVHVADAPHDGALLVKAAALCK